MYYFLTVTLPQDVEKRYGRAKKLSFSLRFDKLNNKTIQQSTRNLVSTWITRTNDLHNTHEIFFLTRRHHLDHHHHHHHLLPNMVLDHMLTCSGLKHPELSLMISLGSYCLLVCSFLVFSVIFYGAFSLYIVTNFVFITVFCPKLGLCLVRVQSVTQQL
jgi:hypothetical protein